MGKIHIKLLALQKAVVGLQKDSRANSYQYLSGNKLLSSIRPLMDKEGLLLKTEIVDIINARQDYTLASGKAKSEILTTLKLKFTWVDCESGEEDVNYFASNGQNDWEKGLGSALTYGERYFLMKYFHLITDEDDVDYRSRSEAQKAKTERAKAAPTMLDVSSPMFEKLQARVKAGEKVADLEAAALTKNMLFTDAVKSALTLIENGNKPK